MVAALCRALFLSLSVSLYFSSLYENARCGTLSESLPKNLLSKVFLPCPFSLHVCQRSHGPAALDAAHGRVVEGVGEALPALAAADAAPAGERERETRARIRERERTTGL